MQLRITSLASPERKLRGYVERRAMYHARRRVLGLGTTSQATPPACYSQRFVTLIAASRPATAERHP